MTTKTNVFAEAQRAAGEAYRKAVDSHNAIATDLELLRIEYDALCSDQGELRAENQRLHDALDEMARNLHDAESRAAVAEEQLDKIERRARVL